MFNVQYLLVVLLYLSLTQRKPTAEPVLSFLKPEKATAFVLSSPCPNFSLYLAVYEFEAVPPPPLLTTAVPLLSHWSAHMMLRRMGFFLIFTKFKL